MIDTDTEQLLLRRLQSGDENAFEVLVGMHSPSMTRVAMAFLPRRAVAEEVVQETWLNVVRSLGAFEGRASLRTWIFTILGNCARRRAEQEQRLIPMAELAAQEVEGDDIGVSADRFFDGGRWQGMWSTVVRRWDDVPEQHLLSSELRGAMLEAIDALPRMQRAVIALRDIEDWPADEVCGYLGILDGNQRILLHRARMTVRATIEEYLEASERRC
ncbi:MAG: sigma-70 family RNA polymerase sigma factor [Thermoleophilia bacterium]|nr:sigma-70 family RNA polymerase sigma factor [Thermoleophilia bacterium]